MQSLLFSLLLLFTSTAFVLAGSNEKSKELLAENAKKDGVVVLPSGLQYKILIKGRGKEHPKPDTPCDCHYLGKLIDGTFFDGSYKREQPLTFSPDQVIAGWTEALQLMVEGDKWELYVPSELAYGDNGRPPAIKGGDALIFEMELIKVGFGCDPVSLTSCNEQEKVYIMKAEREFGSDMDELETELADLRELLPKLGDGASKDLLQSKIKIIEKLTGYHMSESGRVAEAMKDVKGKEEGSKDEL
mmetsp:Transcript_38506/g.42575  ORF Transcript_38506/g.42575 Transcript_38506/m.42575 type:complete len:245 (-) Transcript_38506:66-800(-)